MNLFFKNNFLIIFVFAGIENNIHGASIQYKADTWGSAYLVQVLNQTIFEIELNFPDKIPQPITIPSGGLVGELPQGAEKLVENQISIVTTNRTHIKDFVSDSKISYKPTLKGKGVSSLPNFSKGSALILTPQKGLGSVWMNQQDFETSSSVSFEVYIPNKGDVAICFSDDEKNQSYLLKLKFSSNNPTTDVIENDSIIAKIDNALVKDFKVAPGKFSKFWLSFTGNEELVVGSGPVIGESAVLFKKIPGLNENIKRIGFQSFQDSTSIYNVNIAPPVKLISKEAAEKIYSPNQTISQEIKNAKFEIDTSAGIGSRGKSQMFFEGSLFVIRPFYYEFSQEGPAIICTDKIQEQSYILGKAAQQNAIYSFKTTIQASGNIDLIWAMNPANIEKFAIKAAVGALRLTEGQLNFMADQTGNEQTVETAQQLSETVLQIGQALAGLGFRIAAGALEAQLSDSYRSEEKFYVATDKMSKNQDINKTTDLQAALNQKLVQNKLGKLVTSSFQSRDDFDFFIGELQSITNLIDSPSVATLEIKTSLAKQVQRLLSSRETFVTKTFEQKSWGASEILAVSGINDQCLRLLTSICDNSFLIIPNNDYDKLFKKTIYDELLKLSKIMIQPELTTNIPASKNTVLWTALNLAKGKGSVMFQARGPGDLQFFITEKSSLEKIDQESLKPKDRVIIFNLGELSNSKNSIKNTVDQTTASSEVDILSQYSLNQLDFRPFWINIDDKQISLGGGAFGKNIFVENPLKNPFLNDLVIGISAESPGNEIQNIISGPAIKEISKDLIDFLDYIKNDSNTEELPSWGNNKSFTINNAKGCLICKIKANTTSEVIFKLKNANFEVDYNLSLKFSDKQITIQLKHLDDVLKEVVVNKDKPESIFWLELDKRVLSCGFSPFWSTSADLSCMLPEVYNMDIEVTVQVADQGTFVSTPQKFEPRNLINYEFLNFLSGGFVPIPESQDDLEKQKESAIKEEVNQIVEESMQSDPLLKDLNDEEKKSFTDFIAQSAMMENYGEYLLNKLELDAFNLRDNQDIISTDVLDSKPDNKDPLAADLLADTPDDKKTDHSLRGAERKLASQGLGGAVFQLKGEVTQLKGLGRTANYYRKLATNSFESEEKKTRLQNSASGFGVMKDLRLLKQETSQLFGRGKAVARDESSTRALTGEDKYIKRADGTIANQNIFKETFSQIKSWADRRNSSKSTQEGALSKLKKNTEGFNPHMIAVKIKELGTTLLRSIKGWNTQEKKKSIKQGMTGKEFVGAVKDNIKASIKEKVKDTKEKYQAASKLDIAVGTAKGTVKVAGKALLIGGPIFLNASADASDSQQWNSEYTQGEAVSEDEKNKPQAPPSSEEVNQMSSGDVYNKLKN